MFRTVPPSIIRSLRLYIQHQVYVMQVLWLLPSGNEMEHCATSRRLPGSIPGHWGFFSGASDSSMCPGVDSASKNEYQDIPGGKDGWCTRVTTLPLSCAECLEILEP